jgi:hypothetical protein
MTPPAALTAVIARLVASGLTKAKSPLGVTNASSPQIDRSFAVRMISIGPSSDPGRQRPDVPGVRVSHRFQIEVGHKLKPSSGQEAISQAMTDIHSAFKYLSQFGTTLTTTAAIELGTSSTEYAGGGAYLVQRFQLTVIYNLSLVV